MVFGSFANGSATPQSDIDLLLVIEPPASPWGPFESTAERCRVTASFQPYAPLPLDIWVRTIDEYEEARNVVGGVEYLGARGAVIYETRATRAPIVKRARQDVRNKNVCDLLEDARRVLGRAVRLEVSPPPTKVLGRGGPSYYTWRAIQHAVCAVFAWRQAETPMKADDLSTILAKLAEADPNAVASLTVLARAGEPAPSTGRAVLSEVVRYLARDPLLRPRLDPLARWLARPLYQLADAPELKV